MSEGFRSYPWGQVIVTNIVDPVGAALTTSHSFYEADGDPRQGLLAETVSSDGSWTRYDYDSQRRSTEIISSWLDSPVGAPANQARMTLNEYFAIDPRDTAAENSREPRVVSEYILGKLVSRSFRAYYVNAQGDYESISERAANPAAGYGNPANPRTVTTFHPRTAAVVEANRPKRVVHSDGKLDTYLYEQGIYTASAEPAACAFTPDPTGPAQRTTVTHGTATQPNGIAGKTTRETTLVSGGRMVLSETYAYDGSAYNRIAWTVNIHDDLGHVLASYQSDGALTEATWGCCGKNWERGPDGQERWFTPDALGRVSLETLSGLPVGEFPAQPDLHTTYIHDAAGRQLAVTRFAEGLSMTTSNTFDLAGRRVASRNEAGLVTATAYTDAGRIVTDTIPGGATRVSETYPDGQPKSVTGTAQPAQYHEYGVNEDGTQWTTIYTGPAGLASPVWEKTTTDFLGRPIRTEKPGYNGATLVSESFFDNFGRQVKTTQTGKPDNLYEHDALGNVIRSGQDLNANGILDLASSDRITESETSYTQSSGQWWQETISRVYPDTDSATPKTTGTQKRKLTGLSAAETARTVSTDILGNETVSTTAVNREAKKVTQITDTPDSISNQISVLVNGLLQASWSATGKKTTFGYDALQRQVSVTALRTGTSETHYDNASRVDWTEDAAHNRTKFGYDPATGWQISVTDPLSNTTYIAYTARGKPEKTWGSAKYPVRYEFDSYDRTVKMHTYRGGTGWEGATWPAEPGVSDETTWNYEESTGLLLSKADATGNAVSYTYTPEGKMLTRTWARTVEGAPLVTTYTYSPAGDIIGVDYSDDTPDVTYTHNRLGQQASVASSVSAHTFSYNSNLQLESEVIVPQSEPTRTISRSYDFLGRSSGFSLGDDYSVFYSHDSCGRFFSISSSLESASSAVVYSYLPSSDLLSGYSNSLSGLTVTRSYEDYRNVIADVHNRANGTTISRFAYTNDALGRRVGRADTGLAFAQPTPNAFGYNPRSELITAAMGTNTFGYAYDPIGNRQAATNNGEALTYTANALNQYTLIHDGVTMVPTYDLDGNLTNDGRWANTWDAENRLVGIEPVALTNGAHKVEFAFDFMSRRVQKKVWTWAGDDWRLTETRWNLFSGWSLIREEIQNEQSTITNRYAWGLDVSGSLTGAGGVGGLLAAVLGTNAVSYTVDGNGNVSDLLGPDGSIQAHYEYSTFGETTVAMGPLAEANLFRFSTKPVEPITGLILYEYRPYGSIWGRWLSRDSIGHRGGLNVYAFVRNAPIDLVDILGLMDPDLGVALAIGLGWDNVTRPYISTVSLVGSAEQGLCDNLRFRGDVHVRVYSGGLGTTHGDRSTTDFGLDLTGALSATIGEGSDAGTSSYTLNYQTRSVIQNTFQNSFTWGQAWNYNSALGGATRVGFMGLRAVNFFMQYNNDVNRFPYGEGTDHGWTGGGVLGLYVGGGNSIETGFQDFTGDILGFNRRHIGDSGSRDGYYLQDQGSISLNRAEWFLRYGGSQGSATLSISSPDWLNVQHFIHDYISPSSARFEYPEFRYSVTVEGEIKAKY